MKKQTILKSVIIGMIGMAASTKAMAEVDPNFYIYLCIGQSNMEGQGVIYAADKEVDERFLMMSPINYGGREAGVWEKAVPPICRYDTGLCPADYFGRKLLENLPQEARVGVINVSIAGCGIDTFHPENYASYLKSWAVELWQTQRVEAYDSNPLGKLIDAAKLAQESGVIRGILLHQGETDAYNDQWVTKVQRIYEYILAELNLSAEDVPLLAGEVVGADQGGVCAGANTTINKLPQKISTAYVISSKGCKAGSDNLHFTSAGYRELGRRYGTKAIELLGVETGISQPKPATNGGQAIYSADGLRQNQMQRGLNIVREKDGTVRKVYGRPGRTL